MILVSLPDLHQHSARQAYEEDVFWYIKKYVGLKSVRFSGANGGSPFHTVSKNSHLFEILKVRLFTSTIKKSSQENFLFLNLRHNSLNYLTEHPVQLTRICD